MLTKRIIVLLTYQNGVLFRTKKFLPDCRYTDNFISNTLVDEIILIDISRDKSKENRKLFYNSVKKIATNCFVPIAAGGMISTLEDITSLQSCGADKIVVNSLIYENKKIVEKIISRYGSQFVIGGIDVKKKNSNNCIFINNGKKLLNYNIKKYLEYLEQIKVGEILINSIDKDGSLTGYDIELCKFIKDNVSTPILVAGGCGNWKQVADVINLAKVDGICTSNIFHYTENSIYSLKKYLNNLSINVRQ